MATEYDARRPRLPAELAGRIDKARHQVPFNRWVVETLEGALGQAHVAPSAPRSKPTARQPESVPTSPASPHAASEPKPRSKAFVCPVASCQWVGSDTSDGFCPVHGRELMARRS